MKEFFKENIIQLLALVFLSLLLIFASQVMSQRFSSTANFENIENIDDRIRSAEALGWQVDKSSETVKNIYIPNEQSAEFSEYNKIQMLCGFDLSEYMGKSAKVYTYRVLNFPAIAQNSAETFLHLIIYRNTVIGGDCRVENLRLPVRLVKPDTHIP